jgi:hypothetical protein
VSARPHRPDVDARIEEVLGEADAVAQERAVGEGARGVDGDDTDGRVLLAQVVAQGRDEARLADARWPGDAEGDRFAGVRVEVGDDAGGDRVAVLDQGDRARHRPAVAAEHPLHERLARHRPATPAATRRRGGLGGHGLVRLARGPAATGVAARASG